MYNLPKRYLSYSAIDLWIKNPEAYRRRYYKNEQQLITPEINFGKQIGKLLENADASLSHIKQYTHPEYPFEIEIAGVPIFGYIDSFNLEDKAFIEFKTGHAVWDKVRVRKHLQLPLYSLAIHELHGAVKDQCELIWLETEKIEKKKLGLSTHEDSHGIALTGRVEIFPRTIRKWERERIRTLIKKVAKEIHEDYSRYKDRELG